MGEAFALLGIYALAFALGWLYGIGHSKTWLAQWLMRGEEDDQTNDA